MELDEITTLPNGIRVATEALPGHFSGIGVYVDAGSRYENDALRGVSHIIDRLAFKSTTSSSGDEIIEKTGPVYGLDEEGELRGSYRPSGHPGVSIVHGWLSG